MAILYKKQKMAATREIPAGKGKDPKPTEGLGKNKYKNTIKGTRNNGTTIS